MTRESLGPVVRHLHRLAAPVPEHSDRQLVQSFAAGRDEAAFAELVRRHGQLVWGVCVHVLGNRHDAEDAFQAAFLVLARKAASIRKGESVAGWLFGVARRTALKARTALARRRRHEGHAAVRDAEPAVTEAALREVQAILDDEVQRLPEKWRAPFVLCCLEGKGRAEAAQELGWNEGTLSGRLALARRRLQARLARRGVALTAALGAVAVTQASPAAALADGAVRAALAFTVGGGAAAGGYSEPAVTLSTGVLRAMFFAKIKRLMVVAFLLVLGAGGVALGYHALQVAEPTPAVAQAINPPAVAAMPVAPEPLQAQPQADQKDEDPHWDKALWLPPAVPIAKLAWSPDGKRLAGVYLKWQERVLLGTKMSAPDSHFLSYGGKPGDRQGWRWMQRAAPGVPDNLWKPGKYTNVAVTGLAFSPDGKTLVVASRRWTGRATVPDGVTAFNVADGEVLWQGVEWESPLAEVKPKGQTAEQFAQLLEKERRRQIPIAFSGGGRWVVAGQLAEVETPKGRVRQGVLNIYLADSGKLMTQVPTGEEVLSLAVSTEGRLLVTGHAGGIQVRDADKGKLLRTLTGPAGHKGEVFWLQFIKADQFLSAGQDKFVKLWNAQNGGLIRNFQFQGDQLTAAAVTPDGKIVALAGQRTRDGNAEMALELRDAANGQLLNRLVFPRMVPVRCVAFSPDGALVAISAGPSSLQLWTVSGLLRGTGPPFEKR